MRIALSRVLAVAVFAGTVLVGSVGLPGAPTAEAASASVSCDDPRASAPITSPRLQSYRGITPRRLLDTRNNIGGLSTPLDAGCTIRLSVGADIPAGAQAIALSVTAVSNDMDFITVYPCALGRPESSNLNYRGAGAPTANLVVAIPDVNRQVCIYSHGRTDVIVDLEGWWSSGPDRFASIPPQRVYDSRRPGFTSLVPNQPREIQMPTSVVPADATSVVINLTTTNSTTYGFFVAYPCGSPIPNASNLNFESGEDRAVSAIVGLGPDRKICVVSNVPSNVVVDVNGYYAPAPGFGPTAALQSSSGTRIVDTRNAIGGPRQPFGAGETRSYDPVAGRPGAAETSAVTLNVISSGSTEDGFVTIYPCGGKVPDVSNLNYRAGQITSNLATVELASNRTICVYTTTPTDIIIDLYGQMIAPAGSLAERISFNREVFPAFNPAATDYAIKCPSASTSVGFGLELLPGSSATINGAAAGTGLFNRTMATDGLMTLRLSRGGTQRTYYFRCLPPDFPDLTVQRPGQPSPGWYMTSPNGPQNGPYAIIFDEYGAPVWYRRLPRNAGDFKRLTDGTLALVPASSPFGIDPAVGYWNFNLDGTFRPDPVLRTSDPNAFPVDHHELVSTPGGGRVMLSYPTDDCEFTAGDCEATFTALQDVGTGPPGTPYTATSEYADGWIEDGAFTWRVSEHIPPTESTQQLRFTAVSSISDYVDPYHINAVQKTGGDYVLTARHLDGVFRVDGATGNIEWALGGSPNQAGRFCGQGSAVEAQCLEIVGDPLGGPKRPHDARLNGNVLTMMDNRAYTGTPSRAVAYRIDTTANTATLIWQINHTTDSRTGPTLGSVRVGSDGAILVGWAEPLQAMYQEFSSNGTLLMSIGSNQLLFSYRIVKEPKSSFNANTLRANAGGSIGTPP